LVFLSTRPPPDAVVRPASSSPGEGVVWRRTVHIQSSVLMSRTRHPDTSPMRYAGGWWLAAECGVAAVVIIGV
jgi:hypothetical protein